MSETTCNVCGGKGSYGVTEKHEHEPVDIGGGLTVHPGTSYITKLCDCRKTLPRRFGKASWWGSETLGTMDFGGVFIKATATFQGEMPISEDNYPLHRTLENSYFVVCAQLSGERTYGDTGIPPAEIRDFAKWLVKVAEQAEEYDKPVEEPS